MSQKVGWFETARFGMFIHWGISSVHGCELSWPLVGGNALLPQCQSMPIDTYYSAVARFHPTRFDARAWARTAKAAGMQYAVLTAKHHDGFALFDSEVSDFSVARGAYGKDIVRAFVEAFREAGLRVGLYYSLSDWKHRDYPRFTEEHKPYNFFNLPQPNEDQWNSYLNDMVGQVRELLTRYGLIDILWFDGQWERAPQQWRAEELCDMIKCLQPRTLINDRLPGCGDFETPEQFIPAQPPGRPWETCMTMNESWGYNPSDTQYKSTRQLIHGLCEVAGRGGNLLLNVSPTADGTLPAEQLERLQQIGGWMEMHRDSITGTTPGLEPWQFYGPSTRRGNIIYLHLLMRPYDSVSVRGLPVKRIGRVRLLGGPDLAWTSRAPLIDSMFNDDPHGEITIRVPESALDPLATVIALELRE